MKSLGEDDETVSVDHKGDDASTQPAWMRSLKVSCIEWLDSLPLVRSLSPFFHLRFFSLIFSQILSVDSHSTRILGR